MKNKWVFLLIFAIIFCIIPITQAEAEPTHTIVGYDANREIFIAYNDTNNIIIT